MSHAPSYVPTTTGSFFLFTLPSSVWVPWGWRICLVIALAGACGFVLAWFLLALRGRHRRERRGWAIPVPW